MVPLIIILLREKQMKTVLCQFILFYWCLINNAEALPWFNQHTNLKTSSSFVEIAKKDAPENQLNYSGSWIGQCDNSQAIELNIKHNKDKLSISYGFMTENYVIGEVKSIALSHASDSENSNATLKWNSNQTALIFIHSNIFNNEAGTLNSFFSKVTMVLQGTELSVNGQYFYTNNDVGPIQQDIISCNYHRKNDQ